MASRKRKKLAGDLRNRLITESLMDKTGHCFAVVKYSPTAGWSMAKGYWISKNGLLAWSKLNPNAVTTYEREAYEDLVWHRPEQYYADDLKDLLALEWQPVKRVGPLEALAKEAR